MTKAEHVLSATTTIETEFGLDPSIVSRIRRHIAGLYAELGRDPDLGDRVSMVVYELLENVAKYSASQQGTLQVSLAAKGSHSKVLIRTRNAVTPERLPRLRAALDTVTLQSDTLRTYDDVIALRAAADDGESGLGLARIRAEGQMKISYSIDGESVTIDAEWSGMPSGKHRC